MAVFAQCCGKHIKLQISKTSISPEMELRREEEVFFLNYKTR